jgi:hypothetical protein
MSLDAYISRRFQARGVRFYHAENLANFRTYAAESAVLCRKRLMRQDPEGFTAFYSDEEDESLGVLGRVFGNLYDFGEVFGRGRGAIPNVYGPIMLVFRPEVFSQMRDIRITQRSIASLHARWTDAALSTEAEIELLLQGDKYGRPIHPDWHFCELSCSTPKLPFSFLEAVRVEPIRVHGQRLREVVQAELDAHGIDVPVEERTYSNPSNRRVLQELVELCEELDPPPQQEDWEMDLEQLPPAVHQLTQERQNRVALWCRYFTYGTALTLQEK